MNALYDLILVAGIVRAVPIITDGLNLGDNLPEKERKGKKITFEPVYIETVTGFISLIQKPEIHYY